MTAASSRVLFLLLCVFAPRVVSGQAGAAAGPLGLSLAYGAGALGVRDESISKQRYAGTFPYLAASWSADHTRYLYRVGVEVRQSDRIRNHGVRADVTRFVLGQSFLYGLAPRTLAGRPLHLHAGPLTRLAVFYNEQHIAVDALGFAQSAFVQLSLGARVDAHLPLTPRWAGHASLRGSLLSLGVRGVDDEIDDASPVRLLLPWSGLDTSVATGVRCRLSDRVFVDLSYLFELTRVSAWQPLLSASDTLVGGLTCRI